MKFAIKTDKIFTIIYTVISVLSIIILVMAYIYPDKFINNLYSSLNSINYQTYSINNLFNLMGHAYIGSISMVILYVLAIYAVIIGLPVAIITIFAYIRIIAYKKTRHPKHIRRNLIVKIIYTGIWAVLSLIMTIKDIGSVIIFVVLAFILSILFAALYGMRDHEYFSEY